jgi:hypothetical protein
MLVTPYLAAFSQSSSFGEIIHQSFYLLAGLQQGKSNGLYQNGQYRLAVRAAKPRVSYQCTHAANLTMPRRSFSTLIVINAKLYGTHDCL